MSYQAYLDALETKSGRTPQQLLDEAADRGYGPTTKAVRWSAGWLLNTGLVAATRWPSTVSSRTGRQFPRSTWAPQEATATSPRPSDSMASLTADCRPIGSLGLPATPPEPILRAGRLPGASRTRDGYCRASPHEGRLACFPSGSACQRS